MQNKKESNSNNKEQFNFPPLNILSAVEESAEDMNLLHQELAFRFIEGILEKNTESYSLWGVDRKSDYTVYKYGIELEKSDLIENFEYLVKGILQNSEYDISLKVIYSTYEDLIFAYSKSYEVLFTSVNKIPKKFFLKNVLEQTSLQQLSLTFSAFVDEHGDAYYGDIEDYSFSFFTGADKEKIINFVKCFLTSIIYKNSPEIFRYIILDTNGDFKEFNQTPHGYFENSVEDYNSLIVILAHIKGIIKQREELLNKLGFENYRAYNLKNSKKLEHIFLIINDFYGCRKHFGVYGNNLIRELNEIEQASKRVGVSVCLISPTCGKDILTTDLRYNLSATLSFKTNTSLDSFFAFGNKKANDIPAGKIMVKFVKDKKYNANYGVYSPCSLKEGEVAEVCKYLKENNTCNFYNLGDIAKENSKATEDYNEQMGKRDELLLKEILRYTIEKSYISPKIASQYFFITEEECVKVLQALCNKGHIKKRASDRISYYPLITMEEFKKLFKD